MNPDLSIDEAYVMNLLGHLHVSHLNPCNVNAERVEEYSRATVLSRALDAFEHYGFKSALGVLKAASKTTREDWPARFKELREDLDNEYAPAPAPAPVEALVTFADILRVVFRREVLEHLAGGLVGGIFNWAMIERYRNDWKLTGCTPNTIECARAVVDRAARQLDSSTDPLDWFVWRLLPREMRERFRATTGVEVIDYLRPLMTGGPKADNGAIKIQYAEFKYGMLSPTLSFAALDAWLRRLLAGVIRAATNDLDLCEVVQPGLRDVALARLVTEAELDSDFRKAVEHLLAIPERPARVVPHLADWRTPTGNLRIESGPAASRRGTTAVTVEEVQAVAETRRMLFKRVPGTPRHIRLLDTKDGGEVARVFETDQTQEQLLREHLSGVELPGDGPLLDRVLWTPLAQAESVGLALAGVLEAGVITLARVFEALNPVFPDRADELQHLQFDPTRTRLPQGDESFTWPDQDVRQLAGAM